METIDLRRGRLLRLPRSTGKTVTARTGAVWITEEGRLEDVVLAPGESYTLGRRGVALIEAFDDASISLEPPR
jgi:hypothetical protein